MFQERYHILSNKCRASNTIVDQESALGTYLKIETLEWVPFGLGTYLDLQSFTKYLRQTQVFM